jgi:uncharacterized protein YutE (UPF0331/DUF86 family)
MDWKQFISSIIEHVSWPIVILIIFVLLREQISKLIEKIGHLKYKDLELDFDNVKKQAEAIGNKKENSYKVIKDSESEKVFNSLEEQILETVEKAPAAAVLLAWSTLETAIASAVSRLAISTESPSYRSPLHNLDMLEKHSEISKEHVNLLHKMRELRNKIAHEQTITISITEEQALEYSNTAIEFIGTLNDLNRTKKKLTKPKGEWITLPEGFEPIESKASNIWTYSQIKLSNSDLTAGLGPWSSNSDDGENYKCYSIDIERPTKNGDEVISELTFDLKYISKEALAKNASDLISYDKDSKIITFDLGGAIFEYQFK